MTTPKEKPIYGLEKETVQINEIATIVAARIDDCLRLRSVEAKFNTEHAQVLCKTSNMVYYRISLYAGDNGRDSTFVEIMKEKGCGFSFTTERRAILDAAKGLGGVRKSNISSPDMMMFPSDIHDLYEPATGTDIEDMLDRATDQLHSKNDNTIIFALQNLHSMTTPEKHNSKTPGQVSRYITGNHNCVRDIIASIFNSRLGNIKDERNEQICNLSLGILAISLEQKGVVSSIVDYQWDHFVQMMVPALVAAVTNYNNNTHTACLAMKCLCFIATNSSIARVMLGETNIRKAVEEAKVYGSMEHFRLEQEAHSTIWALQNQLVLVV